MNKAAIGLHYAAVLGEKSNGVIDSDAYAHSVALLEGITEDTQGLEGTVVQVGEVGGRTGFGSAVAEVLVF